MARMFTIEPTKTYKTRENAIKAVENLYSAYPELRYFIHSTDDGRFFPVFVGAKALELGVHFHFNVVA